MHTALNGVRLFLVMEPEKYCSTMSELSTQPAMQKAERTILRELAT